MARKLPYTNFHDLNLDWIIKRIKNVYNDENPPPYPVRTVNGQEGNVHLTGDDIPVSPNDNTVISSRLAEKYTKPVSGIPLSDLAQAVLNYINAKYTKPVGGIPLSDLSPYVVSNIIADVINYIIDDNAGYGDSDKTWSANKLLQIEADVVDLENDKVDKPAQSGTAGQVLGLNQSLQPEWVNMPVADMVQAVEDWLSNNISNPASPPLDRSLSLANACAPADMVGNIKKSITIYDSDDKVIFYSGYVNIASVGNQTPNTITKSTSGMFCGQLECNPGDVFQVCLGGSGNSQGGGARAYAFLDSNRITIEVANRNQDLIDEFITAPANSKYLVVNTRSASSPSAFTYEYYVSNGSKISQLINSKADNFIVEETDNLFNINIIPFNCKNEKDNIIFGTVDQLRYMPLLNINISQNTEYCFEWDYKNTDYNTGTSGPCIVGLDSNGNLVQVTSGSTGETGTSVELKNFTDFVHRSFTVIFPPTTKFIAFGKHGYTTGNEIYTFRNAKIKELPSESIFKYEHYYPNKTGVDSIARANVQEAGYLHDGELLLMPTNPQSIPVNENHLGYNEFIAQTWNTLLPNNYIEGEPYNESRTKIRNVKVERISRWTSTPYGVNTDTYPIYRYIFTPQYGYEKTVLLTSGCHGNEAEGYWGLYRLIRMIYFEGYKYPTLRNLKNVRFIIIPSWNPWGLQHYRRYNAFSALNTGNIDYAKGLQAWAWLYDSNHTKTVEGVTYTISDVGEANVIWETINEFKDALNLWVDLHTDPYAGRTTENIDIDDPRGYEDPYGCYGYSKTGSKTFYRMANLTDDFCNIIKNDYNFDTTFHAMASVPEMDSGFTDWQSTLNFPSGLAEVSTFMDNFPFASGTPEMMKLAQEFYGNFISELLR